MKDIDFDELDKAVNSLMGGGKAESKTESTLPVNVTSASDAPTPAEEESAAVPVNVVTPKQTTPSARRGGRFMDMVSSPAPQPRSVAAAPSREGVAITPRNVVESIPQRTDEEAPREEPTSTNTWPDPLEFIRKRQEAPAETARPIAVSVTPPPARPVVKKPRPFGSDIPLETPFLSDAKVDKRPLNAGRDDDVKPTDTPGADDVDERGEDTPISNPVPEEYDNDLIAIESNEHISEDMEVPTKPSGPAKQEPELEPVPVDHRLSDHSMMREGPTSIMQQYKEQPSSGDQSHAAIYDTAHYAEPLAHPAKKKSGWLWVIWVVVLLGIGAGGAILLYTLNII